MLDQIRLGSVDPQFLADFLRLPESYFLAGAPQAFERFVLRYGTHVVTAAKFGGEFKLMHSAERSRAASLDKFAEHCIRESLRKFSRSFSLKTSMVFVETESEAGADLSGAETKDRSNSSASQQT